MTRESLQACDEQFHAAYDRLRAGAAREAPILVLFGDTLVLFDTERRVEFAASAPCTQVIKAAAHLPVGIFATLQERDFENRLDESTTERLSQLGCAQPGSHGSLEGLDEASRSDVARVLEGCRSFVEPILTSRRTSAAELARFSEAIGPLLLQLTEHATRYELDALHEAAEAALQQLTAAGRQRLEVVVAGVHQARARSLGLQYFQKRFGEDPGEERRVAYAEAVATAEEARDLVGTRRLDRSIARAFFRDATRLQRDVLGDAAAQLLRRIELKPIE
jgi:hypothetical protein